MILTKSKIYEKRIFVLELLGVRFIYPRSFKHHKKREKGLSIATRGGYEKFIYFFILRGANNWNCGMLSAAEENHIKLIDFFISKEADNWYGGIIHASLRGHEKILQFFKSRF
jgi:hypothetical protein